MWHTINPSYIGKYRQTINGNNTSCSREPQQVFSLDELSSSNLRKSNPSCTILNGWFSGRIFCITQETCKIPHDKATKKKIICMNATAYSSLKRTKTDDLRTQKIYNKFCRETNSGRRDKKHRQFSSVS